MKFAIALLRHAAWSASAYLLFAGMLAYSAIVSPGYFAQQEQWIFVVTFAVLLALCSVFTVAHPNANRGRYAKP